MNVVEVGGGGEGGVGVDEPGNAAALPDAPFEAFGRLARTAIKRDHAGVGERRARERFLLRVFRPRFAVGRLVAASVIATAGVASLLLVLSVLATRRQQREAGRLAQRTEAPAAPVRAHERSPVVAPLLWGGSVVRFPGGSELRFLADGRGRIAESSPDRARVVLEEGSLAARVVHRPSTSWLVEAGPFVVRVTGTRFKVAWDPAGGNFRISMTEGSVLVDGPKFSQRLGAGQTLVATTSGGLVRLAPNNPADPGLRELEALGVASVGVAAGGLGGGVHPAPAAVPRTNLRARRAAAVTASGRAVGRGRALARLAVATPTIAAGEGSWSRRLSVGGFREVLAEAKAIGIDAVLARRGLDDLAALATAARLSADNEIARRALSAQRSRFPGTAAAAEAAFLLGRLAEDVDRNPAAAAAWYDRCLEEAPVGDLAAEALGRQLGVMVTQPALRPRAPVRVAARRYLDRFPHGPHAARARALLDAPDSK